MTTTTIRSLALSVISIGFLAAGCGPAWVVVKQATPNPFAGKNSFVVEATHFDNLTVGKVTEAEYVSKKDAQQQTSWQGDKDGMNTKLAEKLSKWGWQPLAPGAAAPAGGFVIRPLVTRVEPGSFNGFLNFPSEANLTLQLLNDQGQVLDGITTATAVGADIYHPSSGQRLRQAAEQLGDIIHAYINMRVAGAAQ